MLNKHFKNASTKFMFSFTIIQFWLADWIVLLRILALAKVNYRVYSLPTKRDTGITIISFYTLCSILSFKGFGFFFSSSFLWVKICQLEVVRIHISETYFSKKWKRLNKKKITTTQFLKPDFKWIIILNAYQKKESVQMWQSV